MEEERGFETAYRSAIEELKMADLEEVVRRSRAEMKNGMILIEYLGQRFKITTPEFEVSYAEGQGEVSLKTQTIILHYLKGAKEKEPTGELIDFRQVPSGPFYYPVFFNTVVRPLLQAFGEEPERLLQAASKLGGERFELGDLAVKIPVLPKIPVTIVFYRGDQEFPPSCKVLLDSTVSDHLHTEDIRIICEELAQKILELSGGTER
jgi:hypothetical protein